VLGLFWKRALIKRNIEIIALNFTGLLCQVSFGREPYEISRLRLVKVGLGISRTNADSQWNPVYNAFHRNFCCGNETIRR